MTLRYFLIFVFDEQNWNAKISLNDFVVNDNLLARRVFKDEMQRHDISF